MENEVVKPAVEIVEVPAQPVKQEKPAARSRAGITKKIARPVAEKKARKLAKSRRQQNRKHNSHSRG